MHFQSQNKPQNSTISPEAGEFDVVVVGAGIGGISAAVSAARCGASTLLVEKADIIGGTGVRSPVTLICSFADAEARIINDGLHREFFPHVYEGHPHDLYTYDEQELLSRYQEVVMAEPLLEVRCGTWVERVCRNEKRITGLDLAGQTPVHVCAKIFLDGTANGNLAAMAKAPFQIGREADGLMQPATLTFRVEGMDTSQFACFLPAGRIRNWAELAAVNSELTVLYLEAKKRGHVSIPKDSVLLLPYPGHPDWAAFNQTRIPNVDPTSESSLAAGMKEGHRQVNEFFNCLKDHPAFKSAKLAEISPMLGVREGRRIMGEYVLTKEDCLGQARFDDMVAACGYALDIHDPHGAGTVLKSIPGTGYYHIPYRSLIPLELDNFLIASRCISGTHEAHSSYRVMAPVSSIGMAAGVAASIASRLKLEDVRSVQPSHIRAILQKLGQFVEGEVASSLELEERILTA